MPAPNPSRGGWVAALGCLGSRGGLLSSVFRLRERGRGLALETNPAAVGPSPLGSFAFAFAFSFAFAFAFTFVVVEPVEYCEGGWTVADGGGGPHRQNRV